jgi:uncharacterized membrane protein
MTFVQPTYLWLLLLLVPLWALALVDPRRVSKLRRRLSLALRIIMFVVLVLALAGAQVVRRSDGLTTVFVLDTSDSVSAALQAQGDQHIDRALQAMPEEDRAALVVFGKEAVVERAPSSDKQFTRTSILPPSDGTDVERAIQLALAMVSAETRNRIVLLSDGAETEGQALDAMQLAQAAGVPVDAVPLISPPTADDVALEALEVPADARAGQQIRLAARVQSQQSGPAQLTILRNRQPVATQDVQLEPGLNRFEVSVPAGEGGFQAWDARITAPNDTVVANDVQFGFTEVRGKPQVLVVEGQAGDGQQLGAALQAAQLDVTVSAPQGVPTTLSGFDRYDAVALVNVPLRALPNDAIDVLPRYVQDLGRGLLMVGGEQSFGAGGYGDTPIEDALPVDMDVPAKYKRPPVSVVVVIDVSGSMALEENGIPKVKLAAEGAARVAAQLRPDDEITVIPFDSAPVGMIGPLPGSQRADALARIGGIEAGGGGIEITPALRKAAEVVRGSEKSVKHIITLTDGDDTVTQEGSPALVEALRSEGVTLTSVAIGQGKDVQFLQRIVEIGGGRFFFTQNAGDVPSIMTEETNAVLESYLVEQTFTPVQTFGHAALRNVQSVPLLYGYIATTPKDTAQIVLRSDRGDPILAQWQYGLGRAAAWTPDMTGRWGKDWVRWDGWGRFAAQVVVGVLPAPNAQGFETSTSVEGNALALNLQADTAHGRPQSGLQPRGRLVQPAGGVIDVSLLEVGPGQYRGTVPLPQTGVYRTQVVVEDTNGAPLGVVSGGAVVPPSSEYLQRDGNAALLQTLAQQTGGRYDVPIDRVWETPTTVAQRSQPIVWPLLWLTVLLWPLDIAVRRVVWGRSLVGAVRAQAASLRRVGQPALRTSASTVVDMKHARALARKEARQNVSSTNDSAPTPRPASVQGGKTGVRSDGTSAPPATSSSTTATDLAHWRRARRGVVERPGQKEG